MSNSYLYGNSPYNTNQGGLYNALSGTGGISDKSKQYYYTATLFSNSTSLEIIYNESWACKRFINLPIEQMFIKPRVISSDDNSNEDTICSYRDYLSTFNIAKKLANVMKSARLNGSAFLMFMTKEDKLSEPLDFNDLRSGDLSNVVVFNRWQVYIDHRETNPFNKNYGFPSIYKVSPKYGSSFNIHHSRVLRFDGQEPLTDDRWTTYDVDYGVSEIIPVLQSIYNEEGTAHAITHLVEEASSVVLQLDNFEALNSNSNQGNQANLQTYAQDFNRHKSVYGTHFIDKEDLISRLEVNLTGIASILDSQMSRLASASGINEMIFLSKSPTGFNSTGDGELESNAQMVLSKQELELRPAYDYIDRICKITSGLSIDFEYKFPSLTTISEQDKANVLYTTSQALEIGVNTGILTVDEARDQLSKNELFIDLQPLQDDFAKAIQKQKTQQALTNNSIDKQKQIEDDSNS